MAKISEKSTSEYFRIPGASEPYALNQDCWTVSFGSYSVGAQQTRSRYQSPFGFVVSGVQGIDDGNLKERHLGTRACGKTPAVLVMLQPTSV